MISKRHPSSLRYQHALDGYAPRLSGSDGRAMTGPLAGRRSGDHVFISRIVGTII